MTAKTDRTTKTLLGITALLLAGNLARPMLAPLPAQAQASAATASAPTQMLIDNGTVYVLSKDTLAAYELHLTMPNVPNLPIRRGTLEEVSVRKITH